MSTPSQRPTPAATAASDAGATAVDPAVVRLLNIAVIAALLLGLLALSLTFGRGTDALPAPSSSSAPP